MTLPSEISYAAPGGHSMRPWSPKPMGVIGDDGIPVDPEYTPAIIPQHNILWFGGRGTPAPTSVKKGWER